MSLHLSVLNRSHLEFCTFRSQPPTPPRLSSQGCMNILTTQDKPTVCPSHDSTRVLSYQSLPTSSELWRGHGQEAKRGSVSKPRITRHVKRWSRCSSCVSPPGCPWSRCDACSVPRLEN